MQKATNCNDVAIVSVKGSDYRIHFWYMNKDDGIIIMKNSNLNEKSESLDLFIIHKNDWYKYLLSKKQKKNIKKSKGILWNNNDRIRNRARNKHRELSDEKKEINREYGRNTKKEEYQKNYHEAKKSKYYLLNKI